MTIWNVGCGVWRVYYKGFKAEKMSMAIIVVVAWVRQQPMKTLKQWRKWFPIIVETTVREIADDVGIWFGSCQEIFTDILATKLVVVDIVPKLLNFKDQKMLTTFNVRLVANHGYDIETKA